MTEDRSTDRATYWMADIEHATELERLRRLEGLRDAESAHYIDRIGVGAGWRCVDVGAGAGSVARHLSTVVGPTGYVVAADMDPRFLDGFTGSGRAVCRHDITAGVVPGGGFDLALSRAVLTHVDDLPGAVANLVRSVRPSGWVLCEEPDYISMEPCDPDHEHADDLRAFKAIMTLNGRQDGYVGRKLLGLFGANGLVEVGAEGRMAVVVGGSPFADFRIDGLQSTRHLLLESGFFDDAAVDRLIAMFRDPTFAYLEATWIATWGRRPNG